MNDAELKALISKNRRPARYEYGDRVIVRAPERGENETTWRLYKKYLGRVATVSGSGCKNDLQGTTNIRFDSGDHSAIRAHWIELI